MTDICKELQFCFYGLLFYSPAHESGSIDINHDSYQQEKNNTKEHNVHLLVIILYQVSIYFPMQCVETSRLLVHFLILHE